MLITDMSIYMGFRPSACGKYSMFKDALIFFSLRIQLYSLLLLRRRERKGSGYETKNAFYNCTFNEILI